LKINTIYKNLSEQYTGVKPETVDNLEYRYCN